MTASAAPRLPATSMLLLLINQPTANVCSERTTWSFYSYPSEPFCLLETMCQSACLDSRLFHDASGQVPQGYAFAPSSPQAPSTYFSPATFRTNLASVPFTSSSHPPDILGRDLCFCIFFSSLISSLRNSTKALSPTMKTHKT